MDAHSKISLQLIAAIATSVSPTDIIDNREEIYMYQPKSKIVKDSTTQNSVLNYHLLQRSGMRRKSPHV